MSDTRLGSKVVARLIGEDYDRHVRSMAPNDFWGQVRRHVFGRPVGEDQIELIIAAIHRALAPRPDDVLLDLACGNGALSHRLATRFAGLHGVDVSQGLIAVAATHFEAPPHRTFAVADVAEYVEQATDPQRFTTALCYGSFPYLTRHSAFRMLETLASRFTNVRTVFLGNLPDLDRVEQFYPGRDPADPDLVNPLAEIGIWRSPAEVMDLARVTGWHAAVSNMPAEFYAAHYRFDATLSRMPASDRSSGARR